MRRFLLTLLSLAHCTEPPEWLIEVPDAFDLDDSNGYLSDFGENVGLLNTSDLPIVSTSPMPPTKLRPDRRLRDRTTTATTAPEAPERPRRARVAKRYRDESESPEEHRRAGAPVRGLTPLDQGRGFALLAANPDISKHDFIASLISSNPEYDLAQVDNFFCTAQKRMRFPKFVRDYLDTHREHLDRDYGGSQSLRSELEPLYVEAGFRSGAFVHVEGIRMWAALVLKGPDAYSIDTGRWGVEFLRLSRQARVELFTQLWRDHGSPPTPEVVPGQKLSRERIRTHLTDEDRMAALRLVEANPPWGVAQLVEAFLSTSPGHSSRTVASMFSRFRSWTSIPLWMHETLISNARLAKGRMEALVGLVNERASKEPVVCQNTSPDFLTIWIQFCVVPPADPCERFNVGNAVFVRIPENMQSAFYASIRGMVSLREILENR